MAITTFSELKTAIADTLNRADLTTTIPNFITMCEAKGNRILRTRDQRTRNAAFTISSEYTAVPGTFREAVKVKLTTSAPTQPLTYSTPEEMDIKSAERWDSTGEPIWYTIEGGYLRVNPTPDTTYTAELVYYAALTALSDGNTSNWLLSKHPDAYLYGSLVHSAPYLKDDDRIGIWAGLFDAIIQDILLEDQRSSVGQRIAVRGRSIG